MEFDLMRLSLIERREPGLFMDPKHRTATREQWLRETLGKQIVFTHRKDTFHFVPELTPLQEGESHPLLMGRIGRAVNVEEHQPPEAGLREMLRDAWRASLVFVDPRHHADGQKVAMENDRSVGTPHAVFQSLVDQINAFSSGPYDIEVSPITDPGTFWDFVENNKGEVTSVTFEFLAPNMFGIKDDWDKEMKSLKDKENVQKTKLTIENKRGLNLKTKRIKTAVNHASRGTGTIKAKTAKGKKFNSNSRVKKARISIEKQEAPTSFSWLKKMFTDIF